MNSIYYEVIAFILLFPWLMLGVTVLGYLRDRRARRRQSTSGSHPFRSGPQPTAHPPGR